MAKREYTWLSLEEAAQQFEYSTEGLRRRLRQLRQRGYLVDTGHPPLGYSVGNATVVKKPAIVLRWVNTRAFLIRSDAPPELLTPKRGRRAQGQP